MRSLFLTCSFFVLVALYWAVERPLASSLIVKKLANRSAGRAECISALDEAGPGAALALQEGMRTGSPEVRLSCARVLANRGDAVGLKALLEALRKHGGENDTLGALAESYLIAVWDQRDGPPQSARARLSRLVDSDIEEQLAALSDVLEKYPGWTGGYVRRGQLYQSKGDVLEIRREALMALAVQPENFEALTLLATAYLRLNAPRQAYICLERAAQINPRMRFTHADLIRQAVKALDAERAKRRRDKRKETPIAILDLQSGAPRHSESLQA